MKTTKILNYFLWVCAFPLALMSCGNITEEITLNEDGSGEYVLYSDMIPSMVNMTFQMTKAMVTMEDSTKTLNEDSLYSAIEEQIWGKFPAEIDSVIDYSNMMPDSIKSDKEKMKFIKRTTGFMKGGKSKGYVYTGLKYEFDNMKDLDAFFGFLAENQKADSKAMGAYYSLLDNRKKNTEYTFSKNRISRKSEVGTPNQLEGEEGIESMIQDAKMQTILHLPKKAKSVKGDFMTKNEGKTIIFEYKMTDLISNKVNTSFDVEW